MSTVSSWVLGNGHSYSAELIAEPATAGQPATRRAIELLNGRPPGTPWTSTELAAAVAVSAQSLQTGFRKMTGSSPMAYLRGVLLERAHQDLTRPCPQHTTVSHIAHTWGFLQVGRFSSAYQRCSATDPPHPARSRGRPNAESGFPRAAVPAPVFSVLRGISIPSLRHLKDTRLALSDPVGCCWRPSTVDPSQICNCVALTSVITHSTRKITVSESRLSRTLRGRALRGLGQRVGITNAPPQAYPRRTGLSAARPGKSGANSSQMRSASPLPFRESPGDPK